MVFSFFKNDPKDEPSAKGGAGRSSRPAARPLAAPVSRGASATVPRSTETGATVPDKDLHRTLAMETAAKIDAIESEMARDFMRPSGFANSAPTPRSGACRSSRSSSRCRRSRTRR